MSFTGLEGRFWELTVPVNDDTFSRMVWDAVHGVPGVDLGVAFRPPGSAAQGPSGVDALLTSPGIVDEFRRRRAFERSGDVPDAGLDSLAPNELADLVWRQLFLDHSPLSEPARTVLTSLGMLGFDPSSRDLWPHREASAALSREEIAAKAFRAANVELALYPVDCFDVEGGGGGAGTNQPLRPYLELGGLFGDRKAASKALKRLGFKVKPKVDEFGLLETRRFLAARVETVAPVALAIGDSRRLFDAVNDDLAPLFFELTLPICLETGLPLVLEVEGSWWSMRAFERMWSDAPEVKRVLIPKGRIALAESIPLAAEHPHVLLCGPAGPNSFGRDFGEFVHAGMETLGLAFHPCRSGATAVEELAGRWAHMRWLVGEAMIRRYAELRRTGWSVSEAEVRRDAAALLGGNARKFLGV